jgi:hypothetical protein
LCHILCHVMPSNWDVIEIISLHPLVCKVHCLGNTLNFRCNLTRKVLQGSLYLKSPPNMKNEFINRRNLLPSTCIPFKKYIFCTLHLEIHVIIQQFLMSLEFLRAPILKKAPRKYEIGIKTNVGHVSPLCCYIVAVWQIWHLKKN